MTVMMIRALALASALALQGCASHVNPAPTERKIGQVVGIGAVSTTPVGAVMYGEFDYAAAHGATLLAPVSRPLGIFGAHVEVPMGTQLLSAVVEGEAGYCTMTLTYHDPIVGPYSASCYYDRDLDGEFETLWVAPGAIGFTFDLDEPVPYRAGEITKVEGFKNELIYSGVNGDTLRVGYREYADNFARPAFSQDLTYPLAEEGPTTIRFRAAEIEVLEAGASEITYRMVRGF